MTKIIIIMVVLLATVAGVSVLGVDTGYVYIKVRDFNIELSLLLLLMRIFAFTAVVHYLWKFINKTTGLKQEVQQWQAHRDLVQGHKKASEGFIALGEGNYKKAQKYLSQAAKKTDYSLVPLLGAANAAQQRGDEETRDFFLNKALDENPGAKLSLWLTKADHMMSLGKIKDAQFVLDRLGKKVKNNPVVLRIQANIFARSSQWEKVLPMIPLLYKKTNLATEEIEQLAQQAYKMGLLQASNVETLQTRWKQLPKKIQAQQEMVQDYVHKLNRYERYDDAAKVLLQSLKTTWNEPLATDYAQLPLKDSTAQIRKVEGWLEQGAGSAKLNLALAQLYVSKELWIMAQDKLQASLTIEDSPEAQILAAQITSKILEHDG